MFKLGRDKLGETPLVLKDIKKEIKKESSSLDTLGCFLIAHTYLYTFMKELFIYSKEFKNLNKTEISLLFKKADNSNVLTFANLSLYHLSNKNLNHRQYSEIIKLNNFRNSIAHDLFQHKIFSTEFRKELNKKINKLIDYCLYLQEILRKRIDFLFEEKQNK